MQYELKKTESPSAPISKKSKELWLDTLNKLKKRLDSMDLPHKEQIIANFNQNLELLKKDTNHKLAKTEFSEKAFKEVINEMVVEAMDAEIEGTNENVQDETKNSNISFGDNNNETMMSVLYQENLKPRMKATTSNELEETKYSDAKLRINKAQFMK